MVSLKKTELPWLNRVNSQTLLAALLNADTAYKNFFREKQGFPKFKSKYFGNQCYHCPQHVKVDFDKRRVHLPKLKDLRVSLHRKFEGKIKTCTVSRDSTDRYYISILVELAESLPSSSPITEGKTMGLDMGIKDLVITSTGEKLSNHKYAIKSEKAIAKAQRRVAKKKKNSNNRRKAKIKFANKCRRLKDQRYDMLHKFTAHLAYESQCTAFAIEDLNVTGMLKNHKLAKAIADCAWHTFIRLLTYKAKWVGKSVIVIDRWFPSTKTCSKCGNVKEKLSLSERTYNCNNCGIQMDRDINAAVNIKKLALEQIGMVRPEYKPVDHAMAGTATTGGLVTHGAKQEAATRA